MSELVARKTKVSLGLTSDLTFEEWKHVGAQLAKLHSAIQWWIGDWLNYGERRYGDMYVEAMALTGLEYSTLTNYRSVAKHVPPGRRREGLSWSHHRAVAWLPPERQVELLAEAENCGWSKVRLEAQVNGPPARTADNGVCGECGRPLPRRLEAVA